MPIVEVQPYVALADPNTSTPGEAANAEIEVVLTGSTTRVALYQDIGGQIPLAQPIRTGARGLTSTFYALVPAMTTRLSWRSGGMEGGRVNFDGSAAAVADLAARNALQALEESGGVRVAQEAAVGAAESAQRAAAALAGAGAVNFDVDGTPYFTVADGTIQLDLDGVPYLSIGA